VPEGVVVSYVHNAAAPGLGKIGVLVALESAGDPARLNALGKQLAMHIAAAAPLALTARSSTRRTSSASARSRPPRRTRAASPPTSSPKMVEGAMAKFRKENALMSQLFVIDNKTKIEDVIAAEAKRTGSPISLNAYVRFQLGEGIEKKESDFAAEVAAASGVGKPEPANA
jgi:elongation factor Ts